MKIFTDEQIQKAAEVDIVDFCAQNNLPLVSDGNRYFRHAEHDSLVVDRKRNSFYWNSEQKSGGPINFVQDVVLNKKDFKQAVNLLLDEDSKYLKQSDVKYVNEPYEYQNKEVPGLIHVRRYLHEQRGISNRTIRELSAAGVLVEDKFHNAVFKWFDQDNHIVGASEQGTTIDHEKYGKRGTRKMIQKNSTTNFGVSHTIGKPKNLKFFESSIDLMSYRDLHPKLKDTQLISMEGLKQNTVYHYLLQNITQQKQAPDSVSICVDNDEAGHNFYDKISKLEFVCQYDKRDVAFKDELCQQADCKDYNDQLKQHNQQMTLQQGLKQQNIER